MNTTEQRTWMDVYEDVINWTRKTFPDQGSISKLRHLREEVDELIEAIKKYKEFTIPYKTIKLMNSGVLKEEHPDHPLNQITNLDKDIQHEFADCFILLYSAADKCGLDLNDLNKRIDEKLQINKEREWNNPDKDGVIRHKKDNQR